MFSMSLRYPKSNSLSLSTQSQLSQLTLACAGAVHRVTDIGHAVDVVPVEPAALGADDVCLTAAATEPTKVNCLELAHRNIISENGVSGQMAILIWIIFLSGFWGTLFADKPISKSAWKFRNINLTFSDSITVRPPVIQPTITKMPLGSP